jgi:hypothetical protein
MIGASDELERLLDLYAKTSAGHGYWKAKCEGANTAGNAKEQEQMHLGYMQELRDKIERAIHEHHNNYTPIIRHLKLVTELMKSDIDNLYKTKRYESGIDLLDHYREHIKKLIDF